MEDDDNIQTDPAKSNHKYVGSQYNPNQRETYLAYFDIHNLYGDVMCMSLPYGSFERIMEVNYPTGILNLTENFDLGYIFEVDLVYNIKFHNAHKALC